MSVIINQAFLNERVERAAEYGYDKAKWIEFCEVMLGHGFELHLYEAKATHSKYITIKRHRFRYKVRFSDHRPNYSKEKGKDCDFFVGRTHLAVTNTRQAVAATLKFFKEKTVSIGHTENTVPLLFEAMEPVPGQQYRKISLLKPNLHTNKRIDDLKVDAYCQLIQEKLMIQPIHVDGYDNIINGTHTWHALKRLKLDCDVPVKVIINHG